MTSPCPACLSGSPCDYALMLSDNIAKKESAVRQLKSRDADAWLHEQDVVAARNELTAHIHGGIPPEAQDYFCDCCGMRGVQHEPYDANRRFA